MLYENENYVPMGFTYDYYNYGGVLRDDPLKIPARTS